MHLLLLSLLALLVLPVMACSEDVDPEAGSTDRITMELASGIHRHVFSLDAGSDVEFEFRSDSEVNLKLVNPEGRELERWEQVIQVDKLSFEAATDGNYKLEIDNTAAVSLPTSVTITMRVFPPEGS